MSLASVIYYPGPYTVPYFYHAYDSFLPQPYNYYNYPFYQRSTWYSDINYCPLQPSYYDDDGNWVAPARICPPPQSEIHIHLDS